MQSALAAAGVTRGRRPVAGVACAAVLVLGALATGCSASSAGGVAGASPPDIPASPEPPATGYQGLTQLPLSAYGTSKQEDVQRYKARKALVVRCMDNHGHQGYTGGNMIRSATTDEEAIRPAGAWGYLGRATAKRHGFHPPPTPTGDDAGLTGRAGQDFKTCLKRADERLPRLAGTDGWKLTQRLFDQSLRQTQTDRRVAAARGRWTDCMTAAGHPAEDPEKLAAGPWTTAEPTGEELAAATADESCTRSAHLAAVYFAVLTAYQRQLVSEHADALTDYRQLVRDQADHVTRLLAELSAV